eukprot:GILK01006142.1.p1 GENE.GILK01006142.1~~GILK01006142.1.p1  ORF type:complete len:362 (-),score=63.77 GILK01006142.1:177-1262(-)
MGQASTRQTPAQSKGPKQPLHRRAQTSKLCSLSDELILASVLFLSEASIVMLNQSSVRFVNLLQRSDKPWKEIFDAHWRGKLAEQSGVSFKQQCLQAFRSSCMICGSLSPLKTTLPLTHKSICKVCLPKHRLRFEDELSEIKRRSLLKLRPFFPAHSQDLSMLRLVYSSIREGSALSMLNRAVGKRAPSIILVEDTDGHVFGGLAAIPWKQTSSDFYGTKDNFLFSLFPEEKVYVSTGTNNHFMLNNKEFIALGGDHDFYALSLDSMLSHGMSMPSVTFNNPTLSKHPQFQVRRVELWAFVDEQAEQEEKAYRMASRPGAGAGAMSDAMNTMLLPFIRRDVDEVGVALRDAMASDLFEQEE